MIKRIQCVLNGKHYSFDSSLSLQAQGLLIHFICHPDNLAASENEILKYFTNQRDSFRRARKELIEGGYVRVSQNRSESGKFNSIQYTICDL